jgi:hypothetical protein
MRLMLEHVIFLGDGYSHGGRKLAREARLHFTSSQQAMRLLCFRWFYSFPKSSSPVIRNPGLHRQYCATAKL